VTGGLLVFEKYEADVLALLSGELDISKGF